MAQHYDVIINSRDEKPLVHAGLLFFSYLEESRNTVTLFTVTMVTILLSPVTCYPPAGPV